MAKQERQDAAVESILERLREARNVDFRNYKRATLRRRIERRMADRGCRTIAEYRAVLDRDPAEVRALIESMLIKVTGFFRDRAVWDELENQILPDLVAQKRPGEDIRVWSAGCATGEEAFSIAMLLAEMTANGTAQPEVKVFATDADEKSIAFARQAVYPESALQELPEHLRKKYFDIDAKGCTVRKELRRSVVFGVNNLVTDAPISRLDLILCRNVFIYLDASLQKRVLARFHYALRRHGILVLGRSELIPFAGKIFQPVDLQSRVYVKDGHRERAVVKERMVALGADKAVSRSKAPSELSLAERFHTDILRSLPVPVVAAGLDGVVVSCNRAAEKLWRRSEGDMVGKQLAVLDLPGLTGELLVEKTAAVREGRSESERSAGVQIAAGSPDARHIAVEVIALRDPKGRPTGLLYTAHDVTAVRELENDLRKSNADRQSTLEEMQTVNEEMQSSNEELETTNEELQSANEELQTTNEELQSTNEELETTNEELQSTNAELDATNRELANRTEEMNVFGFVHRTIVRSLTAAVIVLDEGGRVKMWNLAAERLLGVTEEEATGQVLWTLHIPALSRSLVQRVKKSLQQNLSFRSEKAEYELPSGGKGTGVLSALPIIDGGKALGSLILFDDVTRFASVAAELASIKAADNGKA